YKTLGLGKVIGTPVAGTMTAVWWETQINPYIVFGIPEVTCADVKFPRACRLRRHTPYARSPTAAGFALRRREA
ncbi:MAG: hypothetical protein ACFN4D_09700, partial [Cardiobacterium sp.]